MTQAVAVRNQGDDFQARMFWLCAPLLLVPESYVARVSFESGPRAFDDVMVVALRPRLVGALVSMVNNKPDDAEETLPAASVALAVTVWLPSDNVDELIDQLPPVAVAVPNAVVPSVSYSVTVLPLSAVPVNVGVVLLVMLSVFDMPLSVPLERSGVEGALGAVVSSV